VVRLDPPRQRIDFRRHLDRPQHSGSACQVTRSDLLAATAVRVQLAAFERLGLTRAKIAAEAGLLDADIMDSDGLLPASRVFAMWQNAEREWSRPALGLTAAGQVPFGACEVMDYLMASSATVADAVSQLGDYLALLTRATRFEVHDRRERPYCQMIWRIQPRDVMFHQRDFSLALAADRVFHLSGHRPVCVELLGPPLASGRQYADRFGAEVALRAKRNALTYSRAAWTSALPARDQMLNRTLRRHAQLLLDRQPVSERATIAEQVRAVLLRSSRVGIASIEEVARALATSPRTLQRRLRVEGVRFDTLSENVRASLAQAYLGDPALSISEVAYLIGFSESSAFSRAFRRWTGRTPRVFRREEL